MGIALGQTCINSNDCEYTDEECLYQGESEGNVGYCVRHGANLDGIKDAQPELSGADPEYKHGDHCVDGRAF